MNSIEKLNVIYKYKHTLFDNYYEYLDIIDTLNDTISHYCKIHNYKNIILFDYASFCTLFINNLYYMIEINNNFSILDILEHILIIKLECITNSYQK